MSPKNPAADLRRNVAADLRVARQAVVIAACMFVRGNADRAFLERAIDRYHAAVKKSEEGQVIT